MKVKKSRYGGRKAKIQFWLSDYSGHEDVLDELEKSDLEMAEIGKAAFALWAQSQNAALTGVSPAPSRVTKEMRTLLEQTKTLQKMVIDLLAGASVVTKEGVQAQLEDIQNQMGIIEGAASYGGVLLETPEDDFGDW